MLKEASNPADLTAAQENATSEAADKGQTATSPAMFTLSSPQPSKLLTLPREVRDKILAELLHQYEPLRSSYDSQNIQFFGPQWKKPVPEFDLQISVLYTCRQLYEEGLPILRKKNTLGLDIWVDGPHPRLVLLGLDLGGDFQGYEQKRQRWALLAEVRDLHMVIDFRRKNTSRIVPRRSADYRRNLHEAMKLLRERCPSLPQNLTVSIPKQQYYAVGNESGEKDALTALAMYPAIGKLDFAGVKADTEQMLRTRMRLDPPMPDIYQMLHSLRQYLGKDEYFPKWSEAVVALERLDIRRFLTLRSRMIRDVETARANKKNLIFQEDVSRWKPQKNQLK